MRSLTVNRAAGKQDASASDCMYVQQLTYMYADLAGQFDGRFGESLQCHVPQVVDLPDFQRSIDLRRLRGSLEFTP